VRLNVSKNKVKNITLFSNEENFLNLKWLDISTNKYSELVGFKSPKLEYLDVSYNKLEKINESWTGHPSIKIFKSVENKFKNLNMCKGMPKLEELYLANNSIGNFTGWEDARSLRKIHLRKNKIEKFEDELPELPALEYLNLRGNKVPNLETVEKLF
jgi:Leucine-rich repeat (LRR) protein